MVSHPFRKFWQGVLKIIVPKKPFERGVDPGFGEVIGELPLHDGPHPFKLELLHEVIDDTWGDTSRNVGHGGFGKEN